MSDHRRSLDRLARLLLGWEGTTGPLHRRLTASLVELIDRGELVPAERLPSERSLADALGISRTTVVTVYQRLEESGRIERRQGSGTRVSGGLAIASGPPPEPGRRVDATDTVDLASAALPGLDLVAEALGGFGLDEALQLTRSNPGHHLRGLPALRQRIADYYSEHDVPTAAEEILITSGAQQGLELIVRGFLDRADTVLTEDPTYRGALDTFEHAGVTIRQVRTGPSGVDLAALDQELRRSRPRLAYLQPTLHNPTGVILPADQRETVVDLCRRHGALLVDDTVLSQTVFAQGQPPVLGSHPHLITVGSLNKLFWTGLRVGWVRAAPHVISRLALLGRASNANTSLLTQAVAVRLVDQIGAAAEERRRQLPRGLGTLSELLATHLPDWSWRPPAGGTALWVRIPHGDATAFSHVALRHGVVITPGANFSRTGLGSPRIRLPFGLPLGQTEAGVLRLQEAWHAYARHGMADVSLISSLT